MDEKILTVTVPSYNVQAYLEDCLESFVNSEVMDDIEVMMVPAMILQQLRKDMFQSMKIRSG